LAYSPTILQPAAQVERPPVSGALAWDFSFAAATILASSVPVPQARIITLQVIARGLDTTMANPLKGL
jgi:hypothetical protein